MREVATAATDQGHQPHRGHGPQAFGELLGSGRSEGARDRSIVEIHRVVALDAIDCARERIQLRFAHSNSTRS